MWMEQVLPCWTSLCKSQVPLLTANHWHALLSSYFTSELHFYALRCPECHYWFLIMRMVSSQGISGLSVNTGNLAPPVPAGLMHGTRVRNLPALSAKGKWGVVSRSYTKAAMVGENPWNRGLRSVDLWIMLVSGEFKISFWASLNTLLGAFA